jgi:hypothetical protein
MERVGKTTGVIWLGLAILIFLCDGVLGVCSVSFTFGYITGSKTILTQLKWLVQANVGHRVMLFTLPLSLFHVPIFAYDDLMMSQYYPQHTKNQKNTTTMVAETLAPPVTWLRTILRIQCMGNLEDEG